MTSKVKTFLLYIVIAILVCGILIASSVLFGVPFKYKPVRIDNLKIFTIGMDEERSKAYLSISWTNTSFTKSIDYLEVTITGEPNDGQNNSAIIRVSDYKAVTSRSSNYEKIFGLPINSAKGNYNVHLKKVAYSDGGVWAPDEKSENFQITTNQETQKTELPIYIESAAALYDPTLFQSEFELLMETTNAYMDIVAIVLEAKCLNDKGAVISDNEGDTIQYYVLTDADYEPDTLYPIDIWEKRTGTVYLGENPGKIRTIQLKLIKVIDQDGNVYVSDKEPEVALDISGKVGYLFNNSTDNKSLNTFIERMENNFALEELPYTKPLIHIGYDYALLRYSDVDIRVELDEKHEVRDGEISLAKYDVDIDNAKDVETAYQVQVAAFSASMQVDSSNEEIANQIKDLFLSAKDGNINTGDKIYHYLRPYANYLSDKSTVILVAAMGDALNYVPVEFFSDI